jgi:hypothetical protein
MKCHSIIFAAILTSGCAGSQANTRIMGAIIRPDTNGPTVEQIYEMARARGHNYTQERVAPAGPIYAPNDPTTDDQASSN